MPFNMVEFFSHLWTSGPADFDDEQVKTGWQDAMSHET